MRRISCLSLVATSVALALAAFASVDRSSARAATARSCRPDFVSAIVARRYTCLQRGVSCRARFNAAYHRYLFDCNGGYLVYWWTGLLRRPLHIPAVAAGTPCPAAEQNGTLGDRGVLDVVGAPAFGPGPAYPTLSSDGGRAVLGYFPSWGYEGWGGTKLLWTVPRYLGPYIVRGRQVDGSNELRFDQGPNWTNELHREIRLVGPYPRLNPAATFLRAAGCYAYQVDGRGFSYLIVFEARPAS
jgi:hypothetical protein